MVRNTEDQKNEIEVVAIFRPADHRERESVNLLRDRGFEVVSDPLLEPRATGETPMTEADYVVFTSVTGVEMALSDVSVEELHGVRVCAIGPKTRDALEDRGVEVDVLPDEYTSAGLVEALAQDVEGSRVEVARSDHGSQELLDGLNGARAFVHETVLYELVKPENGGQRAVQGILDYEIDAVLFTSSLTVRNLVESTDEGERRDELIDSLSDIFVGAIGPPTRETAESLGIEVNYVPEKATFEELAEGLLTTRSD